MGNSGSTNTSEEPQENTTSEALYNLKKNKYLTKPAFKTDDITIPTRKESRKEYMYITTSGTQVCIRPLINPYEILSMKPEDNYLTTKAQFFKKILNNDRQVRALTSLAYDILTSQASNIYKKKSDSFDYEVIDFYDPLFLCAIGDTLTLNQVLKVKKNLINEQDQKGRTLLYKAARNGFYDMCLMLLKNGAKVNFVQLDKSTALHGASFYGHKIIVELLLEYGANPKMENKFGGTPISEARNDEITSILQNKKGEITEFFVSSLHDNNPLGERIDLIKLTNGEVIGKRLIRSRNLLESQDISNWNTVWHGTKFKNLQSIMKNGLVASGNKLSDGTVLKPHENHYSLDMTINNIAKWAKAIFVSPTILYAAHICYAERVMFDNKRWCVLVEAKVRPNSYTEHDSTVFQYNPSQGEPSNPEWRIEGSDTKIYRILNKVDIVVISALFVVVDFLDNTSLNYEDLCQLFNYQI